MSSFDELAARMYGPAAAPAAAPATLLSPESGAKPPEPEQPRTRTEEELAAALYGKSPAAAPAAQASDERAKARSADELAEAIYGGRELPAPDEPADPEMQAIRAERMQYGTADAERGLPEHEFDALVGQKVVVGGQEVELDRETVRKGLSELRAMSADLGLTRSDLSAVREAIGFAQTIRGDAEKTEAAQSRAGELLNAEFGNEAAAAFRAARAFVQKSPGLARVLNTTNAGNSPEMVLRIARRALPLAKAGKLTVGG